MRKMGGGPGGIQTYSTFIPKVHDSNSVYLWGGNLVTQKTPDASQGF